MHEKCYKHYLKHLDLVKQFPVLFVTLNLFRCYEEGDKLLQLHNLMSTLITLEHTRTNLKTSAYSSIKKLDSLQNCLNCLFKRKYYSKFPEKSKTINESVISLNVEYL